MMSTVVENEKSCTPRERKVVKEAQRLIKIVGTLSEAWMRKIVVRRHLRHGNITEQDVRTAFKIFGPDRGRAEWKEHALIQAKRAAEHATDSR